MFPQIDSKPGSMTGSGQLNWGQVRAWGDLNEFMQLVAIKDEMFTVGCSWYLIHSRRLNCVE